MGKILKNGSACFDGKEIEKVEIGRESCDGKERLRILALAKGEVTPSVVFLPVSDFRVEVHGNVGRLESSNCATIVGDIESAEVGNCLYADGFITDYKCPRGSIAMDKEIVVATGRQQDEINAVRLRTEVYSPSNVILLEGDFDSVLCVGERCEVIGNVLQSAKVGNCLHVKGNVKSCDVGNMVYATFGVKTYKDAEEYVTVMKERQKASKIAFEEMFDSLREKDSEDEMER